MNGLFSVVLSDIMSLTTTSNLVMYSLLTINVVLLLVISCSILRNVKSVFPFCQHELVSGNLAHSLPLSTCHKLFQFYAACEKDLEVIEDEAEAKRSIEHQADGFSANRDELPAVDIDDETDALEEDTKKDDLISVTTSEAVSAEKEARDANIHMLYPCPGPGCLQEDLGSRQMSVRAEFREGETQLEQQTLYLSENGLPPAPASDQICTEVSELTSENVGRLVLQLSGASCTLTDGGTYQSARSASPQPRRIRSRPVDAVIGDQTYFPEVLADSFPRSGRRNSRKHSIGSRYSSAVSDTRTKENDCLAIDESMYNAASSETDAAQSHINKTLVQISRVWGSSALLDTRQGASLGLPRRCLSDPPNLKRERIQGTNDLEIGFRDAHNHKISVTGPCHASHRDSTLQVYAGENSSRAELDTSSSIVCNGGSQDPAAAEVSAQAASEEIKNHGKLKPPQTLPAQISLKNDFWHGAKVINSNRITDYKKNQSSSAKILLSSSSCPQSHFFEDAIREASSRKMSWFFHSTGHVVALSFVLVCQDLARRLRTLQFPSVMFGT